jgi:hypothetical protein
VVVDHFKWPSLHPVPAASEGLPPSTTRPDHHQQPCPRFLWPSGASAHFFPDTQCRSGRLPAGPPYCLQDNSLCQGRADPDENYTAPLDQQQCWRSSAAEFLKVKRSTAFTHTEMRRQGLLALALRPLFDRTLTWLLATGSLTAILCPFAGLRQGLRASIVKWAETQPDNLRLGGNSPNSRVGADGEAEKPLDH